MLFLYICVCLRSGEWFVRSSRCSGFCNLKLSLILRSAALFRSDAKSAPYMASYLKKIDAQFIFKTLFIRCACPGSAHSTRNTEFLSKLVGWEDTCEFVTVRQGCLRVYHKYNRRLNRIVFERFENPILNLIPQSVFIFKKPHNWINKQIKKYTNRLIN